MKIFYFTLLMGICLLVSCSNEVPQQPNIASEGVEASVNRVPLNEALKEADRILQILEGTSTRARTVNTVEYYGGSTRSEDVPLYYVVNYDNDNGFAVLSAEKSLARVYAISEEGHLDMNDTTFNEGLNIFFRSLPKSLPSLNDSVAIDPGTGLESWYHDNSYRINPLIDSRVRAWHQRNPFNFLCFYRKLNPGNAPTILQSVVGCVPLATAMIMSYYEWPESYGGVDFNWSEMKSINAYAEYASFESMPAKYQSIPRLLAFLGDENNYQTIYSSNAAGSMTEERYRYTFNNFGYEVGSDFVDFNAKSMEKVLQQNKPCLISGKVRNLTTGGHAWVIDGLIFDDSKAYINPNTGEVIWQKMGEGLLFHVIWGWRARCNGYFRYDNGYMVHHPGYSDEGDPAWQDDWESSILSTLRFNGDFTPRK